MVLAHFREDGAAAGRCKLSMEALEWCIFSSYQSVRLSSQAGHTSAYQGIMLGSEMAWEALVTCDAEEAPSSH